MPTSKITLFPDPILRKKAQLVKNFGSPELNSIVLALMETMERQPSGIGIAAPQIGISRRIAIVDVSARAPGFERLILINPVILENSEEKSSCEGCMSVPDYTANLKRFDRIHVAWQTAAGEHRHKVAAGIEAVCIQHEIDHLDGVLFLDHVTSLKTDMIPRIVKKSVPKHKSRG